MRQLILTFSFLAMAALIPQNAIAKKQEKVIVCQIPGKDMSKARETVVSANALKKHLKNGSIKGLCLFDQDGNPNEDTTPEENNPGDSEDVQTPSHEDGIQNLGETDVDCGGETSPNLCELGEKCEIDSDCGTQLCQLGLCVDELIPEAHDNDGIWNGDETDVDCGGSSQYKCEDGKMCDIAADCASEVCEAGACADASAGPQNGETSSSDNSPNAQTTPPVSEESVSNNPVTLGTGGCDQGNGSTSELLLFVLSSVLLFGMLKRNRIRSN